MTGTRPLVWLLVAAVGAGAVALALPAAEPAQERPPDGPAGEPVAVMQMIGLAAPTSSEVPDELRAELEALALRWEALAAEIGTGSPAERAFWQDGLARLQPWLDRRPQALWLALSQLGERGPALGQALVQAMLALDAEAALPQLEALASRWPERALPLYERLLNQWATLRQHPHALQALAHAPLDADTRERLQQQLLAHWAEAAPEQAARWALKTPGQAALLAPLHDRWLQQDARSATIFASTLPPGESRQALLDEGLSRWTAQDGQSARDWLRSQAPLPELDAAIARYASSDELARYAPTEAMGLVARIATPEHRWEAWQALAHSLHDIDPGQVAPLLAQAPGLGPAERARLIDELQ